MSIGPGSSESWCVLFQLITPEGDIDALPEWVSVHFRDLNIVNAGFSHMLDDTRARRESLILELPNNRALLEEIGEWLSTGPPLPLLSFTEMATKQLCIDFHAFAWAGFGLWVGDDICRMETLEDGCLGEGFVTLCASHFEWLEGCSEAQQSEVIQVRTPSVSGLHLD